MDIGPEKETIIVEPLEDPFAPKRERETPPAPTREGEPVKEPVHA